MVYITSFLFGKNISSKGLINLKSQYQCLKGIFNYLMLPILLILAFTGLTPSPGIQHELNICVLTWIEQAKAQRRRCEKEKIQARASVTTPKDLGESPMPLVQRG